MGNFHNPGNKGYFHFFKLNLWSTVKPLSYFLSSVSQGLLILSDLPPSSDNSHAIGVAGPIAPRLWGHHARPIGHVNFIWIGLDLRIKVDDLESLYLGIVSYTTYIVYYLSVVLCIA